MGPIRAVLIAIAALVVCVASPTAMSTKEARADQSDIRGTVPWFERTQAWFALVRAHKIDEWDAPAQRVATMSPEELERIRQDVQMIRDLLEAAATKGDTAVSYPGRMLRLSSLPPLIGMTFDELKPELGEIGKPNSHVRKVLSRLMVQVAMLHTRVAMQLDQDPLAAGRAGNLPRPGSNGPGGAVNIRDGRPTPVANLTGHWAIAREALDIIGPPRASSTFAHAWYRATTAYQQRERHYAALLPQLERVRATYPGDAEFLVASGAAYENIAAPRLQSAVEEAGRIAGVEPPEVALKRAEPFYQQALSLNPKLTLARVRFGRVFDLQGRHSDAAAQLRQAESEGGDDATRYFAALYLGRAEEALGLDVEAKAAYERARAAVPTAQNPILALASLAWRTKSRDEAAIGLRALSAIEPSDVQADPWWNYDISHVGDVDALLEEMRRLAIEAITPGLKTRGSVQVNDSAQDPLDCWTPQQRAPVFMSRSDLVRLDVLVTERGRAVLGLQASDFTVTDNGVRQRVEFVGFDELPLNVMLTFDTSGSMGGQRLDDLRSAGHAVLDLLRKDDRAALISFSHAVSLGSDLTGDLPLVGAALDRTGAVGLTAVVDASFAGLALGASDAGRSLMLVFSDGHDTSSWLDPKGVIDTAKSGNVAVFGVTAGSTHNPFLKDLVNVTGGDLVAVQSTRDVRAAFVKLLAEYRLRYTIAYTPTGVASGGWHGVKVTVGRSGATVKTRDGYQGG